jgi:hypothetical protein
LLPGPFVLPQFPEAASSPKPGLGFLERDVYAAPGPGGRPVFRTGPLIVTLKLVQNAGD